MLWRWILIALGSLFIRVHSQNSVFLLPTSICSFFVKTSSSIISLRVCFLLKSNSFIHNQIVNVWQLQPGSSMWRTFFFSQFNKFSSEKNSYVSQFTFDTPTVTYIISRLRCQVHLQKRWFNVTTSPLYDEQIEGTPSNFFFVLRWFLFAVFTWKLQF